MQNAYGRTIYTFNKYQLLLMMLLMTVVRRINSSQKFSEVDVISPILNMRKLWPHELRPKEAEEKLTRGLLLESGDRKDYGDLLIMLSRSGEILSRAIISKRQLICQSTKI